MVSAETTRRLQAVIHELPAECSKVFQLLYGEGKTVREIAEQLRLSTSTVKTQKARGLAVLQKKLGSLMTLSF